MKTLVWGNIIFAAALLAHILVWKIGLPKRQAKTLALLLAAVCAAGLLLLFLWPGLPLCPSAGPELAHLILYLA
ncbi:MAG TPA: hypothetical protein PLL10_06995, partial [Elusimicrobiales bacterium]|nr:hypothetical protein [Elusimicrobiales bacterium]